MNLIDNFLLRYAKEYDYYHELAHQVAIICESMLQKNGIRAIVTYRAKKPDSLREKLNKRNEFNRYQSLEQIYKDIIDLSGVRIAIYFPSDREEIGRLIENEFNTDHIRQFPNSDSKNSNPIFARKFKGYDATHYRVRIKEEKLDDNMKRYAHTPVEIQIASAFMHAWAEVEHDLVYKPKVGGLSREELKILDELNGIVLSGEVALEKLQKSFKERVGGMDQQFNNHYELAALLREKIRIAHNQSYNMGRVDILLRFLQRVNMDKPGSLAPFLDIIHTSEKENISDKIVELILNNYPDYYKPFIEAKFEMMTHNPYMPMENQNLFYTDNKYLNEFMKHFIELEKMINNVVNLGKSDHDDMDNFNLELKLSRFVSQLNTDNSMILELKHLYNLRNIIIYYNDLPENDLLKSAVKTIQKDLDQIREALYKKE